LAKPEKGIQKKIADGIAQKLKTNLPESGITPKRSEELVKEFNTGKIINWDSIEAEVKILPPAIDPIAEELRASRVVRLTTPLTEIGQYAKAASKAGLNVTKTEVVSGLLLADGRVVMTAGKVGMGAGLFTFAVDGGVATIQRINGSISDFEYQKELGHAAIKGTAVGGSVAVAVVLGATPAGWVVLAVGTGAYLITDFAIRFSDEREAFSRLTIEDLKAFGIPISNKPDFGIPESHAPDFFK
jgi:hypothetical protein